VIAPRGLENGVPAITNDAFVTRDGLRLPLRHWDAGHPNAVIVALHGMGDYSNGFAMPGPWWAAHGITTIAYDQRGFGQAPNGGLWPGNDVLRQDFHDCVEAARAKYPGLPVYALGESMGAAVVLSDLAGNAPAQVNGVVLAAPAVWSRGDMPASYRAALWMSAHTTPWLTVSGSGLGIWPSDNIPMLRALSRDPLMQHETRADAVYGLVNLMDEARRAPDKLKDPPPILIVYGAKDQIIPAAPTEAVIAALGPHAQSRRYPYGYHLILRDLSAETVWRDIAGWIDTGKLP
jgi:alpha-beta hydrolase superfamily lysophospholipase